MRRIILAKHAVETLEFFSMQMGKTFQEAGMEVWFWDLEKPEESRKEFQNFYQKGETIFLTFNFIGLSEENQFEWTGHKSVWEAFEIPCYCIMVDSPIYYFKQLSSVHKHLTLLCIDKQHIKFVEEYYPGYGKVYFLPLGGTKLSRTLPYKDRKYDIVFAGNYVALSNLKKHLKGVDKENKEFYFEIIQKLKEEPNLPLEQTMISYLKKEIPKITRHEILACLYGMVFVDLYIRSYFRREIVCLLAEAGIKVVVLGKDWELSECKNMDNLIMTGQVDSKTCLEYMSNAKISLNIMPWFKEGAHDRIFNSMLQGCVSVSDTSKYITETLADKQDYISFSLECREELPKKIKKLLSEPDYAEKIALQGSRKAAKEHTWKQRALTFLEIADRENT